ncbi:AraC-like DNA-binding protein [Actinomadura hallensis]|uniref:AraC-like DNA-binding protein n=1 Tax=Actinomadura hallensis TaxID=337895 RepID=A0A543ILD9_9ACTN|nr:AraC family transcriptional regulator [Actinomadura hallensis]TQM71359.1 AraC-like DNA-binding protein [Actinomadura hallensis]HLV73074.1 AraC family transcriptional regulator [Vulgatibacteraceae bacterium]
MPVTRHLRDDPEYCEEYGYGLGAPDGILVLKYRSAGGLAFGDVRDDFLHQLYWSPDGVLAALYGSSTRFAGPGEAFWAMRAVSHDVRAGDRQTVYRIFLREVPPALDGLRAGSATVDDEAARLIETIARRGCDEAFALAARRRILDGLGAPSALTPAASANGGGLALAVARALAHDPADSTRLDEWAERLKVSVKTLQRDFVREFGMPYTRWRTRLRLRAARVLLNTHPVTKVAHRVGYASPSAFITAFTKEYGQTPGDYVANGLARLDGSRT